MANRYWVAGGNGDWNDTSNWSTTSGGSSGASVPTSVDDVYFDENSGSGTVNFTSQGAVCDRFSAKGFTGHFNGVNRSPSTNHLRVYGHCVLDVTYTLQANWSISFMGSGSSYNIDAGKAGWLFFDQASNCTYNLRNLYSIPDVASGFQFFVKQQIVLGGTDVTLNLNGMNIIAGAIDNGTTFSNVSLDSTGSTICFRSSYLISLTSTISNLNWLGRDTTEIQFAGTTTSPNFNLGTFNFSKIRFTSDPLGLTYIPDLCTYQATFSSSPSSDRHGELILDNLQVGVSFANNNSKFEKIVSNCTTENRVFFSSRALYFSRTVDVSVAVEGEYFCLNNVNLTGTASFDFSAKKIGNSGNVLGSVTFRSPQTYYWVHQDASLKNPNNYASTSGGTPGSAGDIPLPQDTLIFDANSSTGDIEVSLLDSYRGVPNYDFSNFPHRVTTTISPVTSPGGGSGNERWLNGNKVDFSRVVFSSGLQTLCLSTDQTGTPVELVMPPSNLAGSGENYFSDSLFMICLKNPDTSGFILASELRVYFLEQMGGSFDTDGYPVYFEWYFRSDTGPAREIYLRDSDIYFNKKISQTCRFSDSVLTVYPGTSTFHFLDTSSSNGTLLLGDYSYHTLKFYGDSGTGFWKVYDNPTISNLLELQPGAKIEFRNSSQLTLGSSSTLVALGTPSLPIQLLGVTGGDPEGFICASGNVVCDYLVLQDVDATGGATFYAGANSTDVSGNTGWLFESPPSGQKKPVMFSF